MSRFFQGKFIVFVSAFLALSGVFLFSKTVESAWDANIYNKQYNGTLTADEWNDLIVDFPAVWLPVNFKGPVTIGAPTSTATTLNVYGTITATNFSGAYTGTLGAQNVSSGAFGSNTGGGNYSFPGNVGIGVASPGAKLTIIDPRDSVSDTATYNDFSLMLGHGVSNTNTAVGISFHPSISSLGTPGAAIIAKRVGGYGVADLIFKTKEIGTADSPTLARMTIKNTGNIGIGTTNPGAQLDAVANSFATSSNPIYRFTGYHVSVSNTAPIFQIKSNWEVGQASPTLFQALSYNDTSGGFVIKGNGRVGIGTSNPSSLLDISISGADAIKFQNPGSTEGGITFYDATNRVDLARVGNKLAISSSGGYGAGTALLVDTGTGNVGVGTTTPVAKLAVSNGSSEAINVGGGQVGGLASVPLRTDHAVPLGYLQDNYAPLGSGVGAAFVQGGNSFGTTATLGTNDNNLLNIETNNTVRMTVAGNGNVGIGTTTPTYKFVLAGDAYIKPVSGGDLRINYEGGGLEGSGLKLYTGTNPMIFQSNYAGPSLFSFNFGNSPRMVIQQSGNVGIGTTAPTRLLNLHEPSGNNAYFKISNNTSGNIAGGDGFDFMYGGLNMSFVNRENGFIAFETNNAEKLRITNTGNVGIQTTNPQYSLDVNGNARLVYTGTSSVDFAIGSLTNSYPYKRIDSWTSDNSGYIWGFGYRKYDNTNQKIQFFLRDQDRGIYSVDKLDIVNFTANEMGGPGLYPAWSTAVHLAASGNSYINAGNLSVGTTSSIAKLAVSNGTGNTISAVGGQIFGLNSTPVNADHAVPLGYLQGNYAPLGSGAGGLGIGITGQTLRHDGTSWVANSVIYNNGTNVGIGVTSPSVKFHVAGQGLFNDSLYLENGYIVGGYGGSNGDLKFAYNKSTSNVGMVLTSLGNVGIGTTAPGRKLSVSGDVGGTYFAASDSTGFVASNNAYRSWSPIQASLTSDTDLSFGIDVDNNSTSNAFIFRNNATYASGSELMRITETGNLGIGTTNPAYPIDITSANNTDLLQVKYGAAYMRLNPWDGSYGSRATIRSNSNNGFGLLVNSTNEAMTVNVSGNVGINTTSPVVKLAVSAGTGDAIYAGGGQVGGLASTPLRIDHAVPLGYLQDNYSPSSGDLWEGTKNGSIWNGDIGAGNVGIGTTNPDQKLVVTGNMKVLTTGNAIGTGINLVRSSTGDYNGLNLYTNSTIDWSFGQNSAGFGIYYQGAAATTRFMIQPGGNVGIGTTNPLSKFDVYGTAPNLTIHSNGRLVIDKGTTSLGGGGYFEFVNSNPGITIGITDNSDSNHIRFNTRPADNIERERMRVTAGGNVGIATSNPQYLFDINKGADVARFHLGSGTYSPTGSLATQAFFFENAGGSNDYAIFQTKTSAGVGLNITNAGNVSIGTTTPVAKFVVAGGTGDVINVSGGQVAGLNSTPVNPDHAVPLSYLQGNYAPIGSSVGSAFVQGGNTFGAAAILGTNDNNLLNIETNNTVRMTVAANGNIGVGTTTPVADLEIKGKIGTNATALKVTSDGNATDKVFHFTGNEAAGYDMVMTQTGNVGIGTTNPGAKFHVMGSPRFEDLASGKYLSFDINGGNQGILTSAGNLNIMPASGVVTIYKSGFPGLLQLYDGSSSYPVQIKASGSSYFNGGSLGVGITNPGAKLDIFSTTTAGSNLKIQTVVTGAEPSATIDFMTQNISTGGSGAKLEVKQTDYQNNAMIFSTETGNTMAERMRIHTNGSIGINTTSPAAKLAVSAGTGNAIYAGGGYVAGLNSTPVNPDHAVPLSYLQGNYSPSSGDLWEGTKNGNIWNGDAGAGNVGIGTTNPGHKLVINQSGASTTSNILMFTHENIANSALWIGTYQSNTTVTSFQNNNVFESYAPMIFSAALSGNYLSFGTGRTGATFTETMRITGGNVGIGTAAPGTKLHVYNGTSGIVTPTAGLGLTVEDDTSTGVYVQTPDTSVGTLLFGTPSDAFGAYLRWDYTNDLMTLATAQSGGKLAFITGNGAEAMRILDTGSVGIGTTTPVGLLHLVRSGNSWVYIDSTSASSAGGIVMNTNGQAILANYGASHASTGFGESFAGKTILSAAAGTGMIIGTTSNNPVNLGTSGLSRLYIQGGGNVGINTTSPVAKLAVSAGTGNAIYAGGGQVAGLNSTPTNPDHAVPLSYLQGNYAPIGTGIGSAFVQGGNAFGTTTILGTNDNNLLNIETNNTVRMTVTANGNVGIGITNPNSKLSIASSTNATDITDISTSFLNIRNTGSTASKKSGITFGFSDTYPVQAGIYASADHITNANASLLFATRDTSGDIAERVRISSAGNVGIGTTTPTAKLAITSSGTSTGRAFVVTDSANDEKLIILDNGNVGFDKTPTHLVDFKSTINVGGVTSNGSITLGSTLDDVAAGSFQMNAPTELSIYKARGRSSNILMSNSYGFDFITEGVSALRIANAATGNLGYIGIGTTNPSGKLDVRTALYGDTPGTNPILSLGDSTPLADWMFRITASEEDLTIDRGYATASHVLTLQRSSGNVGINTTSPVTKLAVSAGTGDAVYVGGGQVGGLASIPLRTDHAVPLGYLQDNYSPSSGDLWEGTKNGNIWNGDAGAGNVGIGTNSPGAKLEVYAATGSEFTVYDGFYNYNIGDTANGIGANAWGIRKSSSDAIYENDIGGHIFRVDNSEKMRVDRTGNIGIGTTNPDSPLQVVGAGYPVGNFKRTTTVTGGGFGVSGGLASGIKLETNTSGTMADGFGGGFLFSLTGVGHTADDGQARIYAQRDGNDDTAALSFLTHGINADSPKLIIRGNGNVGVGTTDPQAKLEVVGGIRTTYSGATSSTISTNASGDLVVTSASRYFMFGTSNASNYLYVYGPSNSNTTLFGTALRGTYNSGITTYLNYAGSSYFNGGNIGIGTTTPVAKLAVSGGTGNVIYTGGGQVAGLPSVQTEDDQAVSRKYLHDNFNSTSTSFWSGSLAGSISNANTGNVGIGTTASAGKLHVSTVSPNRTSVVDGLLLENIPTGGSPYLGHGQGIAFYGQTYASSTRKTLSRIYSVANDHSGSTAGTDLVFQTISDNADAAPSTKMIIRYNGNVGIGTTDPQENLSVVGSDSGTTVANSGVTLNIGNTNATTNNIAAISFGPSGAGNSWSRLGVVYTDRGSNSEDQDMFFGTIAGGSFGERMRINSIGYVGIGTTNPLYPLHIYKTGVNNQLFLNNPTGTIGDTSGILFGTSPAETYAKAGIFFERLDGSAQGSLHFATGNSGGAQVVNKSNARMTINMNGNVGVGTTTPSQKLDIVSGSNQLRLSFNSSNYADFSVASNGALAIKPSSGVTYFNSSSLNNTFFVYDYSDGTNSYTTFNGSSFTLRKQGVNNVYLRNSGDSYFNGGNIGIGSTTPNHRLSVIAVDGNGIGVGGASGNAVNVGGGQIAGLNSTPTNSDHAVPLGYLQGNYAPIGTGIGSAFVQGGNSFGTTTILGTNDNYRLDVETNNTVRMTVANNGNVGIGTTTLTRKFQVEGGYPGFVTNSQGSFVHDFGDAIYTLRNSGGGRGIEFRANTGSFGGRISGLAGGLLFSGNGGVNDHIAISTSGNMGIGTTNPIYKLEVVGTSTATTISLGSNGNVTDPGLNTLPGTISFNYSTTANNSYGMGLGATRNGKYDIWNQTGSVNGGGYRWYIGTSEKMTMDYTGNVGIGITNPINKLHVSNGTGDAINAGGGQVIVNLTPLENYHAASKLYVDNNFAPIGGVSKWSDGASGSIYRDSNVGIGISNPVSKLHVNGGVSMKRTPVADANYTVQADDYIIGYTSISANRTVTLPNALCTAGRFFVILDESGNASATAKIIIDPEGTTPIIGLQTLPLEDSYNSVYVFCGNNAWYIL